MYSCSSINVLQESERLKFSLKGNQVFYENKKVGVIGPMEYEYSNGKFQQEISVVQNSAFYDEMTIKIAKFLSLRYPKAKIEVKVPRDDQLDKF
tara:strand:- start:180 stop:461 length:282 start_codon:yes stop_codon:yes gene_type:complete